MMPLLMPLLLSRKKRVRSTTLFTTEESIFDLLMLNAVDVVIVVIA